MQRKITLRKLRWNRVLILAAALILCLSFAFNAFGDTIGKEQIVEVTVSDGDTLWSLIKEYNSAYCGDMNKAVYTVQQLNDLNSACIYQGQTIKIPIFNE